MIEKYYASCDRNDWMTSEKLRVAVAEFRDVVLDPCAPLDPSNWFSIYGVNGKGGHYLPGMEDPALLSLGSRSTMSGLSIGWAGICVPCGGLCFVNPPYGGRTGAIFDWMRKCADEANEGCEIVGLVPAATGSQWFKLIWRSATAICFLEKRQSFSVPGGKASQLDIFGGELDIKESKGGATFWSAMPYWGADFDRFNEHFSELGEVVELRYSRNALEAAKEGEVLRENPEVDD